MFSGPPVAMAVFSPFWGDPENRSCNTFQGSQVHGPLPAWHQGDSGVKTSNVRVRAPTFGLAHQMVKQQGVMGRVLCLCGSWAQRQARLGPCAPASHHGRTPLPEAP